MLRIACTDPTKEVSFSLLAERTYTVGRKVGDIIIPNDTSVSRSHAELTVEHPPGNINSPLLTPVLTVMDVGSKFGTYATEPNIEAKSMATPRERITLSIGDKVRFGLQWNEFQILYTPFVVTTSSLKLTQEYKDDIVKLGGHYVTEWDDKVTHVVMEAITLTVKVTCALLSAKPIVTPAYIKDLVSAFQTNKAVPDVTSFLPPIREKEICSIEESNFYPNAARTTLFAGKTFLFYTMRHLNKLVIAIKAGGGIAKTLAEATRDNVTTDEFIIMANHLDISQAEKNPEVKIILETYKKAGKRFVVDGEIGLAALYNSLDKFCNPMQSISKSVLPQISTQTQSQRSSNGSVSANSARVIPETQESNPNTNTQRSSLGDNDVSRVNETISKSGNPVDAEEVIIEDEDDDIIEVIPQNKNSSSLTVGPGTLRGGKRPGDETLESGSSSGKKRSAPEPLAKQPDSKRLREASSAPTTSPSASMSVSRMTRSSASAKINSSKALQSIFNMSDSDDDEGDDDKDKSGESRVVVPESQPQGEDVEMSDEPSTVVPDSQQPVVNIVDLKKLQSMSRTQDTVQVNPEAETRPSFLVPPVPPISTATAMATTVRVQAVLTNPGTDMIDTVRASVMNAKTLPCESFQEVGKKRSKDDAVADADAGEGTSTRGKKRRRVTGEDNAGGVNEEEALVARTKKINIKDTSKVQPKVEESMGLPPPPRVITRPLLNPNLSRLETTLLSANDSVAGGKKNYKCFKKVLPKFLAASVLATNENNPPAGPGNVSMNTSLGSIRSGRIIRLTVRDYIPGGDASFYQNMIPPVGLIPSDHERTFEEEEMFQDPVRARSMEYVGDGFDLIHPINEARASALNGAGASASSSGTFRKRPNSSIEAMPPPRPPPPVEEEDIDDEWSFK